MTPQTQTSTTAAQAVRDLETALLEHASITHCAVRLKDVPGDTIAVAYVAVSGRFAPAEIRAHLARTLPDALPVELVPVSSLPLTDAGTVDDDLLAALPVLDEDAARSCEKEIERLPAVARAAVVVQEIAAARPVLHLSDLVPETLRSAGGSNAAKSSGGSDAASLSETAPRVPSLVRGPALRADSGRPATLKASIERAAREFPDSWVRYLGSDGSEVVQTYAGLLEDGRRILGGLRQMGLAPQDKVLFQLEHVRDFVGAFWACVLGGFVPVPITIASTYRANDSIASKLFNAWRMFDAPVVLTSAQRVAPIEGLFAECGAAGARVAGIDDLRAASPDFDAHSCAPHDLALIMLTSGSTGAPKGVMLSHDNVLRMAAGVQQQLDLTDAEVTLNWMPMDHVAGLVMSHQRDVLLGCNQVHVPTEVVLQRPVAWLDLIDRFRVTLSFAPNFAFGLVNQCAEEIGQGKWDLSSLRVILNAGEMIVARTTRRFMTLLAPHKLPPTAMVPVWGMSETSSGIVESRYFTVAGTSDEDSFVEVGEPVADLGLRIVNDAGQVVEQGIIGHLQVHGTVITRGYYERPDLDAESFTADGWFKTGDLAVIRNNRLAITGRAKDDININGIKYFSHEIESVVESVPGVLVSFTAACAVRRPGADSEDLVVFFVPSSSGDEAHVSAVIGDVRRAVVTRIGIPPGYVIPVTRGDIPKTNLGKIQRAHIRKRFETGGFAAAVKRLDILARNANTLPDWFLRQTWKPAVGSFADQDAGSVLVMADAQLGPAVVSLLANRRRSIVVQPGADFARVSADRYQVRVSSADDYERLVGSLADEGVSIGSVVHLLAFGPPESAKAERDRAALSVLFLARALSNAAGESAVRFLVAGSRAQALNENEDVEPERSAVLGLMQTIVQEMPTIDARHVDVPDGDVAASARALVDELRTAGQEREVAYRGGIRFVSRFERLGLPKAVDRELPFKTGGMYLLTGGLGGVGVEIGKFLLEKYQARLLVLGRTPVVRGADAAKAEEVDRLQSHDILAAAAVGHAAFRYEPADVTNAGRVREIVQAACADWACRLDGVVHLAGVFRDRLLLEETAESLDETHLPKMDGTAAVAGLLDRNDQVLIAFSSSIGYLGRFSGGAYGAASRGLDAIVRNVRRRGVRAYSLAWSEWEDMGMMRGWVSTQSRSRGYTSMSKAQGLNSLITALRQNSPVVLIGIDADAAPVRPYVADECRGLARLVAFVQPAGDAQIDLSGVAVSDRFGSQLPPCDVERVEAVPTRANGEVDRDALVSGTSSSGRQKSAPTTELERAIAKVWEQVLGVTEVDARTTFFDAGGSSLLMARVYARLKTVLPHSMSMTEMFRYPTVAALAAHLGGSSPSTFDNQIAGDRERGRERRARLLQTRRGRESE